MRAVSDATRCIDRWDGLQLGGRTLRVGRPADYSPVLPHLDTFVMDIAGNAISLCVLIHVETFYLRILCDNLS